MPRKEYGNEKEDQFYLRRGAKPPERSPHLTEDELREALAAHIKDHRCDWIQNGNEILCDTSDFEHGRRIGTSVRLAGTDNYGQPVLVPVGPIMRNSLH